MPIMTFSNVRSRVHESARVLACVRVNYDLYRALRPTLAISASRGPPLQIMR
jgi:hypothetical protein